MDTVRTFWAMYHMGGADIDMLLLDTSLANGSAGNLGPMISWPDCLNRIGSGNQEIINQSYPYFVKMNHMICWICLGACVNTPIKAGPLGEEE